MRKRLFAAMAGAMLVLGLAGCSMPFGGSKEPTAQELMESVEAMDLEKYNDMAMEMEVASESEGQAVSLSLTTGVEMKGSLAHVYDMDMSIGMSGFNLGIQLEGWMDNASKISYMNMSFFGQDSGWIKAPMDDSNGGSSVDLSGIMDIRDTFLDSNGVEYVLEPHEKGQDYIVTWTMDGNALGEAMDELLSSYTDGAAVDSVSSTAVFNGETRAIKSITAVSAASADGAAADVKLEIRFNTINGEKDLAIPADVISSAVDEDDSIGSFSFGFGGDDDGSSSDDSFGGFGDDDSLIGPTDDQANIPYGGNAVETENYSNDGNGYDEVIDALSQALADADIYDGMVYVYHYDGFSEVSYYFSDDDWSATFEMSRYLPDWYQTAEEEYAHQFAWMRDEWYGEDCMVQGDDETAVFLQKDEDYGSRHLDMIGWEDDMFLELALNIYTDMSDEDALSLMASLMNAIAPIE